MVTKLISRDQIPTPGKGLQDVGGLCCFHDRILRRDS
jgi:hypothetical protein